MSLRYTVVCALLLIAGVLLGYENYRVWSAPSAAEPRKDQGKKVGEIKPDPPNPAGAPKPPAPLESFQVIAEKNMFSPERQEFSSTAAAAMSKPVTRPQVTLQGVVVAEEYQSASIINPGRPLHKGERETKSVKVGDSVGEYKIAKILADRIVLEAGEDSFEVLLYDPRTPKRRVEVKTAAPPAAITSTATTSAAAPAVPPPPAAAPVPPPGQFPQPPRPTVPAPLPRGAPGQAQGGYQQPVTPAPATPAPAQAPDPGTWRGRRPVPPGTPPG
jgi:hypothetical protein